MAARSIIAAGVDQAVIDIRQGLDAISTNLGLSLPLKGQAFRNHEYEQMVQLQHIAECLKAIAVVTKTNKPEEFEVILPEPPVEPVTDPIEAVVVVPSGKPKLKGK